MIKAGVHFGHRTSRWNPKMEKFIFGKRQKIHIIDLRATLSGLVTAERFLKQVASRGKTVLFVGTKRQARSSVIGNAETCGMFYVGDRWLGGMLTNFKTIRSRISRLEEIENILAIGNDGQPLTKKMISSYQREHKKIHRNLCGVREMNTLPGAIVVIDPKREAKALLEANKLGIPVIALLDTDCDPERVDICIPGNDDALRSIQLVLKALSDAINEGKAIASPVELIKKEKDPAEEKAAPAPVATTEAPVEETPASTKEAEVVTATPEAEKPTPEETSS